MDRGAWWVIVHGVNRACTVVRQWLFQLIAILNTSTMNILKHAFLCHYLLVLLLEVELDIR